MHKRIAELYDQALVVTGNGDYFAGELDIDKFASLIVQECASIAADADLEDVDGGDGDVLRAAASQIRNHFGVE